MASFKIRLLNRYVRKTSNLNSNVTADPAKKLIDNSARYMNDNVPDGFEMTKKETECNTKYQLVTKKGDKSHKKAVLYIHGGAYVAGLIELYRKLAPDFYSAYKKDGGADIFYLDYRLAPDAVYPSQLNEAVDMWNELTENLGYLPKDIFVLGDSAGAHLTTTLLMKLRDEKRELPAAAACISLWGDMVGNGKSFSANYGIDVIFGEKGKTMTEEMKKNTFNSNLYSFIGDADRNDPYISPVYGDFENFPPMFMSVGSDEMLLDDTLRVVRKLKEKDIDVELEVQQDMFHIYPVYRDFFPQGKVTIKKLVEFMKKYSNI